jgi:hypothetical protein
MNIIVKIDSRLNFILKMLKEIVLLDVVSLGFGAVLY